MPTQYVDCPECDFPILAHPNAEVTCPNCGITGTITGVTIPTTLFWVTIAFIAGIVSGPYLKKELGKYG